MPGKRSFVLQDRVAFLDSGIGNQNLLRYLKLPTLFSVAALCDQDVSRAQAATDGDNSIRIVTDIANVLADPDIDHIESICSPRFILSISALLFVCYAYNDQSIDQTSTPRAGNNT